MTFSTPYARRSGQHGPAILKTAAGPASRGRLPGHLLITLGGFFT
jgi:hypothetical protein